MQSISSGIETAKAFSISNGLRLSSEVSAAAIPGNEAVSQDALCGASVESFSISSGSGGVVVLSPPHPLCLYCPGDNHCSDVMCTPRNLNCLTLFVCKLDPSVGAEQSHTVTGVQTVEIVTVR